MPRANRSALHTSKPRRTGNAPTDGQLLATNGLWRLYERNADLAANRALGWRNLKLVCTLPVRDGKANYWVSYRAGDDALRQSDSHRLKAQHAELYAWVLGLVKCPPPAPAGEDVHA
jgi:hypothetical protein